MKREIRRESKRTLAVVLVALAAAVTGCASKKAQSTSLVTSTSGSVAHGAFIQQGEAQLRPGAPITRIAAVGDAVYVYTAQNRVYGLSEGLDLRFFRQITAPNEVMRPPVQVGEEVVFPTSAGLFVTSKAGEPLRTVPLQHPLSSDLRVDQRNMLMAGVVSDTGGRVAVIDPTLTVHPTVQETLIGNVVSTPASLQGIVYAGTEAGKVFAIANDNQAAWDLNDMSFDTRRSIRADLIVDEYALYVASTDSTLYALDRNNGRIRWRFMAEAPLTATPMVTRDRVYQVVPDRGLAAIDKLEGKLYREPLWIVPGITKIVSVDDRYVYAVRGNETLVALGIADGKERFSATGRFDFVAAGAQGDTIFAASRDGVVVKLKRGPFSGEDVATAR